MRGKRGANEGQTRDTRSECRPLWATRGKQRAALVASAASARSQTSSLTSDGAALAASAAPYGPPVGSSGRHSQRGPFSNQDHPRGVTAVHAPLGRNRPMRPRILGRMCNSAEIHTKKCHLFTPRPPPSRQVLDEFWTFMFFKSHKNVTTRKGHRFGLGRGQLL